MNKKDEKIRKDWIPQDIPLNQSNVARIYDYFLGGHHNFEVDRQVAQKIESVYPDIRIGAITNRAFLCRAVEYVVREGIEQIIDLGSGIPTVGNVHDIAQAINPEARVIYVDIDRIAVAHSQAMLTENDNATAIRADAAYPRQIIDHEEVKTLIDFDQPLALFGVAIFHLIPEDERLQTVIDEWKQMLSPGSYFVIAHPTYDDVPQHLIEQAQKLYASSAGVKSKMRSWEEIKEFFAGFEIIEPGLVHAPNWRPESPDDPLVDEPERSMVWAGVGLKP